MTDEPNWLPFSEILSVTASLLVCTTRFSKNWASMRRMCRFPRAFRIGEGHSRLSRDEVSRRERHDSLQGKGRRVSRRTFGNFYFTGSVNTLYWEDGKVGDRLLGTTTDPYGALLDLAENGVPVKGSASRFSETAERPVP